MPQQQLPGATTTTTSAAATNGGPRVSFNRDVHVKRIGKRPSDLDSYHQLPPDIDPEDIRKEAALVISQAGRHQSKAENGDNIPTFRAKQKRQQSAAAAADAQRFHSLPTRRKSKGKPVTRSVSDAATKKPPTASKRPSIFGLFSRKSSDTNVNQSDRDPRFDDVGARRLVRSKSDVGSTSGVRKSPLAESQSSRVAKKVETLANASSKTQLSPIIEQSQREDFFEKDYFRERERRKSDAITLREKDESGQGLNELLARSRSKAELDGPLLKSKPPLFASNSIGPNPSSISAGIRDRIEILQAKSNENMHSSQQPAERLPLTKGRTVDGLVKRLSMERFSPQPVISQPAFSYIRPNEGITYAQLDLSNDEQQQERTPPRPPRANQDRHQVRSGSGSYSPIPNGNHTNTTRMGNSHSPSPWQQLSPRNQSDEDEGLGFETRKVYYEDEYGKREREPPIVPVIRSVSPAPYLDNLGYRRAQLENRILTRRFGETTAQQQTGGTLERQKRDYLSPERERSVPLDISPQMEKTSRYRHTKYYDDGQGGIKETYVRETQTDGQIRESRHRERISASQPRYADRDYNSAERLEQEPKSLDSQLTDQYRSSPELRNHHHQQHHHHHQLTQQQSSQQLPTDYWQSSLKRDKLQQRSFDKGDSGIENDFRKESFNGEITSRWRKRTTLDDIRVCESFLRKERRDSAQQQRQLQRQLQSAVPPTRLRREHSYVYRERSIDDGSHFDPHLDKYPIATSTLRRREKSQSRDETSTLKRNKKLGGFEKVKQLFTGNSNHGGSGRSSTSNVSSSRKDTQSRLTSSNGNDSTLSRRDRDSKEKERYMVREDEMRSRYREHHALNEETSREPKTIDISMRRRLSTPKASPLLIKRSPADKPAKQKQKEPTGPLVKTSWFKSLDRRAKSSPKEQLNVSVNGHSEATTSSLKRTKRNAPTAPAKNLRFFGDTDLDSNPPTISKASSMPRSRPPLASKHSQSAYNLDRSPPPPSRDYRHSLSGQRAQTLTSSSSNRQRASSMQHLDNNGSDEVDFRKRRHYSRSRELHDISESGSEPEPAIMDRHKRGSSIPNQRAMSLERTNERSGHLLGPPKPARSAERRGLIQDSSYGRDRYPAESSGTEGESSLHSQRSVVYLHATTVGDIPQPYNSRHRSMSRDDLRKGGGGGSSIGGGKAKGQEPLQPMTRTVSRSVSMLAPWKPKHISEGYEINYSQEQNKRMSTLPRKPPPHNGVSNASATMSRVGRKNSQTPTRRGYQIDLERPPPPRSLLSASNLRSAKTK
ncbi:serine/arginine repetitive matrix protein 2 [Drosophila tropicalis]|uniref:serine/arginine repetitive matrix protein 2 n=1 Tax=Drosophila tropicalis TaxID=46794 RepID=UPI0035ABBC7A